jgi:hypothetical protein
MDDIEVTGVTVEELADPRVIRLNISYHLRFDNSDIMTPAETSQETFSIDVPA